MTSPLFQIAGIYDQRTLKFLSDEGIKHFTFDLRPTSFNFFQLHRCLDLLKSNFSSKHHYSLHFAGEADFVIQKILQDLEALALPTHSSSFSLIFSDKQQAAFYDQFNCPYQLLIDSQADFLWLAQCRNLTGLIFSFEVLEQMHQSNQLLPFLKHLFKFTEQRSIELVLSAPWKANFFPSLLDYFDFDRLILSINPDVEVCYRNVDLVKLKKSIDACRLALK